ncbi:MAG TPA: asparagine synthase-related protein [Tepidisphaeraceae bacterium]|nr:asparagine synthase-related protein [Tepidisphaeraceae bacterium]
MCGFAGIVSWSHRHRVDRAVLARMNARIAHRGPDGEGVWLSHDGEPTPANPQVGLAHRRLAIIDLDPRANQPFTDDRGRWVVYNGEIYNYRELRRELERLLPNYRWKTECDTEVLLAAYEAWGDKCVEHLNGMFAFAIWDGANGELFLARDRMGQKPLYYAYISTDGEPADLLSGLSYFPVGDRPGAPQCVAFASELPAVRAASLADLSLDESALTGYLHFGYVAAGESIYRGVRQLPPALTARCHASGASARRYWPPADTNANAPGPSDGIAVMRTRDMVRQAVRRQLVADVHVGCLLSGGIDSSVVAAGMKATAAPGQEVFTFSIGFDDPRYDESEYARHVAAHLGTTHHAFTVRPDAVEDLPRLAAVFGEPFGDSSALPTHYLAREARRHVKVALGGDGGDELFGGYDRYRAMALARTLRRTLSPVPFALLGPVVARLPGSTHPKSRAARARRFFASVAKSNAWRFAGYHRLFDGDTIVQLLGPPLSFPAARSYGPTHADRMYYNFGEPHHNFSGRPADRLRDPVRAALALDRIFYLPNDLLTKVDRASMLHNLEVRSPFMDHELVEFAATLTTPQLLNGGPKRMLREAFAADLPPFVFKRKKMGFAVPIGEWFRGPLRAMLRDHLFATDSFARAHFHMPVVERLIAEHEAERVDHAQRLYALLMLELWWRTTRADAR